MKRAIVKPVRFIVGALLEKKVAFGRAGTGDQQAQEFTNAEVGQPGLKEAIDITLGELRNGCGCKAFLRSCWQ